MNTQWTPDSQWVNHPTHTHKDWVMEVVNNDTRLSYVEWVNHQIEMLELDTYDTPNNEPIDDEILWAAIKRYVNSQSHDELQTFMADDLADYYFQCASRSEIQEFIDTWSK